MQQSNQAPSLRKIMSVACTMHLSNRPGKRLRYQTKELLCTQFGKCKIVLPILENGLKKKLVYTSANALVKHLNIPTYKVSRYLLNSLVPDHLPSFLIYNNQY